MATEAELLKQAKAALERWPWIPEVEDAHKLPRWLMLAVGSRETNLRKAFTEGTTGDGGHGHGVWQLDDRFHPIPAGFDTNVRLQGDTAAAMLAAFIKAFPGNLRAGVASYNGGAGGVKEALRKGLDPDSATTGRNYGADVLSRRDVLTRNLPESLRLEDWADMIATDPGNGDYWVLLGPEGKVDTYFATGLKGNRFFGDMKDHPEFGAGPGTPIGPAVAIDFWSGNGNGVGYVIYTRDPQGGVHPFHFDKTTKKPPA